MIKQFVEVIQVVLDITAYLICIVSQLHLPFGELYGLVDVELMLFDQFLLLLQDQLDVLIMFLGELTNVELLNILANAYIVVYVGSGVC